MATDGEATEEETGDPEKFVIKIEVKRLTAVVCNFVQVWK